MGYYENGIETRNRILAVCRKLFYEKGYKDTTFKDICKEARVNQSSIYYHFKAKDVLLRILYQESIQKNNRIAEMYCEPGVLPFTKFLLGGEFYLYKAFHDPKYRRFGLDARILLDTNNFGEYIENMAIALYSYDKTFTALTEDSLYDLLAMLAYDQVLLIYLDKNIESCNLQSVFNHNAEIYKRIIRVSDKDFAISRKQLADLEKKYDWSQLETSLEP
jgi:AcrR family transcriptional regulator